MTLCAFHFCSVVPIVPEDRKSRGKISFIRTIIAYDELTSANQKISISFSAHKHECERARARARTLIPSLCKPIIDGRTWRKCAASSDDIIVRVFALIVNLLTLGAETRISRKRFRRHSAAISSREISPPPLPCERTRPRSFSLEFFLSRNYFL